ncbi:MAG: AAA family ATPase [bacterium]
MKFKMPFMIYLIGGPPRCGKTTLAKEMSKKLKIPWISSDALEVVSREYVSKEKRIKLYPYSFLRKKGVNRNNDEFYSKYSAREIINVLKKQAKTSFRAIDMMIANEIDNGNDYIIEGYHILPSLRS